MLWLREALARDTELKLTPVPCSGQTCPDPSPLPLLSLCLATAQQQDGAAQFVAIKALAGCSQPPCPSLCSPGFPQLMTKIISDHTVGVSSGAMHANAFQKAEM